ncbi:MAG: hypothetical protein CMC36_05200 [Flavobacteriaceae bacterium]|nr:hypothetical protein [Flavobacteriaceae bacterium]|tara:strand:+ start:1946 stop:2326 length:381 start_codon:yes stop_codon:yes gene_type:complete
MYRLFVFCLIIFNSCDFFNPNEIKLISNAQFIDIEGHDYTLVDVRTTKEYESGHIPNAISIDFNSKAFENKILKLDKRSSIVLYCRTQNRSAKAANFLKENNYEDISIILGGINSWVKNGNEIDYN